jgi:hypothetical protein
MQRHVGPSSIGTPAPGSCAVAFPVRPEAALPAMLAGPDQEGITYGG